MNAVLLNTALLQKGMNTLFLVQSFYLVSRIKTRGLQAPRLKNHHFQSILSKVYLHVILLFSIFQGK